MKSASILLLALPACGLAQDPATGESPQTAAVEAPPLGKIVTEIDPRIWVIHQSRNGDHWFGSNGAGLYRYDGRKCIRYTQLNTSGNDQVRDIQEDAEGHLLIATNGGVSKFDGERFTTLEIVDPPSGEDGWELNPDDVWIPFDPGSYGTLRYDGEKLYHLKLPKSPAEDAIRAKYAEAPGWFVLSSIYSAYKDRRGHLWFGTAGVGLCRYDGQTMSWMYEEQLTTTPSGGAFGIRSVYEDRAGDFWICNTRHRFKMSPEVVVKDGYNLIKYSKREGLPDAKSDTDENFSFCPSMTEDKAGALWLACSDGRVLKHDGDVVTPYPIADGAYVATIHCDQTGKLWVGTIDHGIYTFDGERFVPFALR